MTALTIQVPRINDELGDFYNLAGIWGKVMEAGDGAAVIFDFSRCDFLRPNAVVFLGGLARTIGARGGTARFDVGTLGNAVRTNLEQNGFAHAMGADVPPWPGNSIPYREYFEQDEESIIHYLKAHWLGRSWVNVSDALAAAIAGQMWEIFANAFEHGGSPVGVFCCGQYLPRLGELLLAVADFGVGIPSNARIYLGKAGLAAEKAMRWAFVRGTSTSRRTSGPRGVGLDLLKEFVQKAEGCLRVFSHDGCARIDTSGESYQDLVRSFEGTLVQVRLRCDDRAYVLSNELNSQPFF